MVWSCWWWCSDDGAAGKKLTMSILVLSTVLGCPILVTPIVMTLINFLVLWQPRSAQTWRVIGPVFVLQSSLTIIEARVEALETVEVSSAASVTEGETRILLPVIVPPLVGIGTWTSVRV